MQLVTLVSITYLCFPQMIDSKSLFRNERKVVPRATSPKVALIYFPEVCLIEAKYKTNLQILKATHAPHLRRPVISDSLATLFFGPAIVSARSDPRYLSPQMYANLAVLTAIETVVRARFRPELLSPLIIITVSFSEN